MNLHWYRRKNKKPLVSWTLEQCKQRIMSAKFVGESKEVFWEKAFKWHRSIYEKAISKAEIQWADDCLLMLDKAFVELNPNMSHRIDALFAKEIMDGKEVGVDR